MELSTIVTWHPMAGDITLGDVSGRVTVAWLAGYALGFERRRRNPDIDTADMAILSLVAAVFTLVSAHGFALTAGPEARFVDPTRIAAQVVAIGGTFAAAAAIFRSPLGVRGLTTGVTVLLSLAVGVLAGAGAPVVVLMVVAMNLLTLAPRWLRVRHPRLRIAVADGTSRLAAVGVLEGLDVRVTRVRLHADPALMTADVRPPQDGRTPHDLVEELLALPGIAQAHALGFPGPHRRPAGDRRAPS